MTSGLNFVGLFYQKERLEKILDIFKGMSDELIEDYFERLENSGDSDVIKINDFVVISILAHYESETETETETETEEKVIDIILNLNSSEGNIIFHRSYELKQYSPSRVSSDIQNHIEKYIYDKEGNKDPKGMYVLVCPECQNYLISGGKICLHCVNKLTIYTEDVCPICLEGENEGRHVSVWKASSCCNKIFHSSCIDKLSIIQIGTQFVCGKACPCCRHRPASFNLI